MWTAVLLAAALLVSGDAKTQQQPAAEDQAHFDNRWGILQRIPAAVKFISYEPALGPFAVAETRPFTRLAYIGR